METFIEILRIFVSGSGAAIAICITIVIVVRAFVHSPQAFDGTRLRIGTARFERKLEPSASSGVAQPLPLPPPQAQPVKADSSTSEALPSSPETPEEKSAIQQWFDGVKSRDRKAIDEAFDRLKHEWADDWSPYEIDVLKQGELMRAGFEDALTELKKLENDEHSESGASRSIAYHYLGLKAFELAKKHAEIAMQRARKAGKGVVDSMLLHADLLAATQSFDAAIAFLRRSANEIDTDEARSRILESIASRLRDNGLTAAAIEDYQRVLIANPENKEARFQLAYLGDKENLKLLALHHYKILLKQSPTYSMANNNLGILYGDLGFKRAMVKYFRSSFKDGNNYGLGNLAHTFLAAGFSDEAFKLYDDAPSELKGGDRAAAVYAEMVKARNEDAKKIEDVESEAASFASAFSESLTSAREPTEDDFLGEWESQDSKLTITRTGTGFQITQPGIFSTYTGSFSKIGRYVSIDVEVKHEGRSILGGYSSGEGRFIVAPYSANLRVVHLANDRLKSSKLYNRKTTT